MLSVCYRGMFMRRARGWKAHAQEEDKKTKGAWSRKMVHSHVLKRSMMKT